MLCFLRTFNSEFSYTEVWFKPLEIEHEVNITLVTD